MRRPALALAVVAATVALAPGVAPAQAIPAVPPGLPGPGGLLPPPPSPTSASAPSSSSGGSCMPTMEGGRLAVTIQIERGPRAGTRATLGPLDMATRAVPWDGATGGQYPWGHLVAPDDGEALSEESLSAWQEHSLAALMAGSDTAAALTSESLSLLHFSLVSCQTMGGTPGLTLAVHVPPGLRPLTWPKAVVVVRPAHAVGEARALLRGQWFTRVGSTVFEPATSSRSAVTLELWASGQR